MWDMMPTLRSELGKLDHLKRNLPSCGGRLLLQQLPTENRGAIRARERLISELVKICILYIGIEDVFT